MRSQTLSYVFSIIVGLCFCSAGYASMPGHITSAIKQSNVIENRIKIKAPDIAENGSVVSVGISEVLLGKDSDTYVTNLWFFDHFRPAAVASFDLSPTVKATGVTTRIRLAGSSVIYAVAQLSDGSVISGHKSITVTIGGCGGESGSVTQYGNYTAPTMNYQRPIYQAPVYSQTQLSSAQNTERYASFVNNGIVSCSQQPLSTFSIDVDTGSYSNIRRFLMQEGRLPVLDAVRVEEMINYFDYDYPVPANKQIPFSVMTEVGPNPWNKDSHLLHIGLKAYEEHRTNLPPANLVFLIDVSGSMQSANKIGLLKSSLKILSRQLRGQDSISIVVYAGRTGVILKPTAGDQTQTILSSIDQLMTGGSTDGGAGILLAYDMARTAFKAEGINRVILATDGDFNVGVINHTELLNIIKQQRKSGITLTTLGFGTGNYNEKLMEQLADHGNGNYAYIDSFREAKKVLIEQISGTLFTIAKDVKIQVEFNPAIVAEYRLIGYENRLLRTEDFRDDKVDAGDIGAGHTVTALYEVTFTDSKAKRIKPLRYANPVTKQPTNSNEIAVVQLRYKLPHEETGKEVQHIIQREQVFTSLSQTSDNYRFSAAVAAMGQWLRRSDMLNDMSLDHVKSIALDASKIDPKGYRNEFIDMIDVARELNVK